MKIYRMLYDNNLTKDGIEKENELLGDFELIAGNMNGYSYECIVIDIKSKELYILTGREISGYYHPNMGGTKHFLEKLTDNYFVKMYLKYKNEN